MGLAERVLARREVQRSDPVTMEEFGYLLGQANGNAATTRSGINVGPRRAMGITAWYRGVAYLTNSVAGLPVHTYRSVGDMRERRASPPWLQRPDVELPRFGLIEQWMMALLHKGNAYSFKLRNSSGQVVGLRPIHPDRVKPGLASDGTKVFQIDNRTDVGYTTREILHIPGLGDDGLVGLNPIQYHAESLGLIAAADQYAARFFGKGAHLRAYITLPQTLDETQATALKQQWERFHAGVHADEFGVLGNGAEYKTISLDPQQTQLLETRKFSVTEIARILGVVPHKLYDLERATFSNIEHQAIEAVTDSIRPWVVRIEAYVNFDRDLLAGADPVRNFIEFQLEGLLRGDLKSRYEAMAIAIGRPWKVPNEARRLDNEAPIDGGDTLYAPMNFAPVLPDGTLATPTSETPAP